MANETFINAPAGNREKEKEMTPIFLNDWDSKKEMIVDFEGAYGIERLTSEQIAKYDHVDVLLASYSYQNYSGDAFVLFRNKNDGKLYEVHGSHCSCYGLEGQWSEEFCDLDSLKHRVTKGYIGLDDYSGNAFKDEIRQLIHDLEVPKA